MRFRVVACSTTKPKNCLATSAFSSRSRFFVNTVTSHTGSSIFSPTNQRNSRLYSHCSINRRSLRTVYRTCKMSARRSFSGGIDGRPIVTCICENAREDVSDFPDGSQRMIGRDTLLRRQITEHCRLLMVKASHKTILCDYVLVAKPWSYFFRSLLVF